MKTEFWATGKTKQDFISEGISFYLKRIKPLTPFNYLELESKKAAAEKEIIKNEEEAVIKNLKKGDSLILLDDKGESFNSEEFATFLQNSLNNAGGRLIFLAGGNVRHEHVCSCLYRFLPAHFVNRLHGSTRRNIDFRHHDPEDGNHFQ